MATTKKQKEQDLAELTDLVKAAKSVVFSGYRGTTVKDLDKFRRKLRKEQVFTKVYKITLLRKALAAAGIQAESLDYKAPVIISVSSQDETLPARIIKGLSREIQTISMLDGVVSGSLISKSQVNALADLPGKDQLRAILVGTINAPVSGFVNVMAGNLRGLVNVLNRVAAK